MGIAIEVYRTCREAVREHGGGRLRTVRLAVGELSAVERDVLAVEEPLEIRLAFETEAGYVRRSVSITMRTPACLRASPPMPQKNSLGYFFFMADTSLAPC